MSVDIKNTIKRTSPVQKYLEPPFQIDTRLLHNPCFHTTHLKDYTIFNRHKYSKVKSKYKQQL